MNQHQLETFRQVLVQRGRALFRRRRQALADEETLLVEREPDWEDVAAHRTAASLLESVGEAERIALARIRLSLDRIDRGTYGECVACSGHISAKRLRAVPETDRCARCAAAH